MGVLWLWWISVSFLYYNLLYLIPISLILIALFYGFLFLTFAYISKIVAQFLELKLPIFKAENIVYFLKALSILALNYIEPFGFNWLKPLLIFTDSAFGLHIWQFALILLSLALYLNTKRWYLLLIITFGLDFKNPNIVSANTLRDIELVSTNIDVKEKWKLKNRIKYTKLALKKIDSAIAKGKKLIILPESILPYFLNLEQPYLQEFLNRSKEATIIVGSLYYKKKNNYKNSAYIIKNGEFLIANKVVLVPFGETNPLPRQMGKVVNKIFFDGSVDYIANRDYTYIDALNKKYKIVICYEGTSEKTYLDKPKFLIVISNNGWFVPSIEPTLQRDLLKYYATIYKTTIYHSVNGSGSYVVVPYPDI